jgi:hypothetical protein
VLVSTAELAADQALGLSASGLVDPLEKLEEEVVRVRVLHRGSICGRSVIKNMIVKLTARMADRLEALGSVERLSPGPGHAARIEEARQSLPKHVARLAAKDYAVAAHRVR